MIDDAYGFFGETETVGLTAPEITALDGVLHEAGETVVVHFSSASSVDASLRGDTVCTAGCIVEGEGLDVVAQFTEGGGAGRAGAPKRAVVAWNQSAEAMAAVRKAQRVTWTANGQNVYRDAKLAYSVTFYCTEHDTNTVARLLCDALNAHEARDE